MNLFQNLQETKHQITIVDAHGCILVHLRRRNLPGPPIQYPISNGTIFSEEESGTNGISSVFLWKNQ